MISGELQQPETLRVVIDHRVGECAQVRVGKESDHLGKPQGRQVPEDRVEEHEMG